MGILDLTGKTFGRLHVDKFAYTKNYRSYWECTCTCGNKCIKKGKYLTNGETKSCGCLSEETRQITGKNNKKYNRYDVCDTYVIVYCTKGEFKCDIADWENMKCYYWHITEAGYARGTINGRLRFFHDVILDIDTTNHKYAQCDHINRDRADNRRENLRVVTAQQNAKNKGIYKNNQSGHSGIHQHNKKWEVYIGSKHMGVYNTYEEALEKRITLEKEYNYENNSID